jgi:hypothetical protein
MVTVNTAASTGDVVKRNRFWWGRMALCVTRCTRAGTPVVGCPQQQFLGMVNFYRRFLPGIARTLQPLTDALRSANVSTFGSGSTEP